MKKRYLFGMLALVLLVIPLAGACTTVQVPPTPVTLTIETPAATSPSSSMGNMVDQMMQIKLWNSVLGETNGNGGNGGNGGWGGGHGGHGHGH